MVLDIKNSFNWCGKELVIEQGGLCSQADAGLLVNYGGTTVLVAVTLEKCPKQESERFGVPLSVDFLFRDYARGRFPAGFIKREGRQNEREILASRMIDRSIRPLIDDKVKNGIAVNCMLISYDKSCKPEIPALIGTSIALKCAGVPISDIVVGMNLLSKSDSDGIEFNSVVDTPDLDLFVSSTSSGVVMVEAEGVEIKEEDMLSAIKECYEKSQSVIDFINTFISNGVVDNAEGRERVFSFLDTGLFDSLSKSFADKFQACFSNSYSVKSDMIVALSNIREEALSSIQSGEYKQYSSVDIEYSLKKVEKMCFVDSIFANNMRLDSRGFSDVRDISIKVDLLPEAHGSSLFTRGGTQALAVATLGGRLDAQTVDDIDGDRKEAFLLHYNFLPFSVGEIGGSKAPNRREIGHGKLAWKAVKHVLPEDLKVFPYSTRLVSEILSSDGSSSMATVCAASLALMRAGVPIKKHVAGVAMGLIKNNDDFVILTDISGYEDAFGDMDFKVAGTDNGITAIQMDMKVQGINFDILEKALEQALRARKYVLKKMIENVPDVNKKLNAKIPVMKQLSIDKNAVSKIIGSGGKNVKAIAEATSSMIDILDNKERCNIVSKSVEGLEVASAIIAQFSQSCSSSVKIGENYKGLVLSIMDFGVFVEMGFQVQGIIPSSSLKGAVLKEGQIVSVTAKGFDAQKKIKLVLSNNAGNAGVTTRNSNTSVTASPSQVSKNSALSESSDKVCGIKLPKVVDGSSNHRFFSHPQTTSSNPKKPIVHGNEGQTRGRNVTKPSAEQIDKNEKTPYTTPFVKRGDTTRSSPSDNTKKANHNNKAKVGNSITSFLNNNDADNNSNTSNDGSSEVRFF